MSKRKDSLDQDIDEEMDELSGRYRFRNPFKKKRNRLNKDPTLSKIKRNRHRYDET